MTAGAKTTGPDHTHSIETPYGWAVLAVSLLLVVVGYGSTLLLLVSLKQIAVELDWPRSVPSLAYACNMIGIGLGGIPTDMVLMGLDPSTARDRAAEALDVILELWDHEDGPFTHHGEFFNIDAPELDPVTERGLHMKPFQRPHPPIALAASTPHSNSLRIAGARGWSPMSSSILSSTLLPGHWDTVLEGANDAGKTPDRSQWRIARDVFVGPTPKIARERARVTMGRNYDVHQRPSRIGTIQIQSCKLDPSMSDDDVDVDYLMENVWIVGDPSECADKIRALHSATGGFGTLLTVTADSDDPSWDHESLRLLAEEVGPQIEDLH